MTVKGKNDLTTIFDKPKLLIRVYATLFEQCCQVPKCLCNNNNWYIEQILNLLECWWSPTSIGTSLIHPRKTKSLHLNESLFPSEGFESHQSIFWYQFSRSAAEERASPLVDTQALLQNPKRIGLRLGWVIWRKYIQIICTLATHVIFGKNGTW